jgi:aminodeoxychorismate synthase component I
MSESFVYLDDQIAGAARFYDQPVRRIVCYDASDVDTCFADVGRCLAEGLHVAGYASYELGYALEPKLAALMPARRDLPLLNFAAFERCRHDICPPSGSGGAFVGPIAPAWSQVDYADRFARAMAYIRAGDVYQINLTFPMIGEFAGDAVSLYLRLRTSQPVRYGGVVQLDGPSVVTLSPELFFRTAKHEIHVRPMKGTAGRGLTGLEDRRLADDLRKEEKSRAENLMIVDLLRNDLGRVCRIGSVDVTDLFTVETFPTLHQMTSGIRAELNDDVDIAGVFRSLFPCGSVTGAPKIRAMEIIRELEPAPRGVYCGAIGFMDPNGTACFNVAIRTASLFGGGRIVYNVGSAVVADSRADAEYRECLLKAKIMTMTSHETVATLAAST